jgi:hypothetical protein
MLECLLTHRCTVTSFTSTVVNLRTVETPTNTTGVACHIQVEMAAEVPKGFGYEREGMWDLWVSSTAPVAIGNQVRQTVGPYTGRLWNVRAPKQSADEAGLEHRAFKMELFTSS